MIVFFLCGVTRGWPFQRKSVMSFGCLVPIKYFYPSKNFFSCLHSKYFAPLQQMAMCLLKFLTFLMFSIFQIKRFPNYWSYLKYQASSSLFLLHSLLLFKSENVSPFSRRTGPISIELPYLNHSHKNPK